MATCGLCGKEHWECVCSPEDCPDCDGTGYLNESDCCGGTYFGESNDDGMCGDCHEHCCKAMCETCDGTGNIYLPTNM